MQDYLGHPLVVKDVPTYFNTPDADGETSSHCIDGHLPRLCQFSYRVSYSDFGILSSDNQQRENNKMMSMKSELDVESGSEEESSFRATSAIAYEADSGTKRGFSPAPISFSSTINNDFINLQVQSSSRARLLPYHSSPALHFS